MQAVVAISGNQYLVTPGQEILVHRLSQDSGEVKFSEVMLVIDGENVEVGKPYVSNMDVVAEVMGEVKGEKVTVLKFKAKSRYHKTTGFRPKFTKLKVLSIGSHKAEKAEPKTEAVETKVEKTTKPRAKSTRETKASK